MQAPFWTVFPAVRIIILELSFALQKLGSARWHAFRRGMAQDLLDSGSTLSYILRAGGWRSGAFLRYLTGSSLDDREALEFTVNDSDSDAET